MSLAEIRSRAVEVAKDLRELRETPESKRGDNYATDVRTKTVELNALDAEEKRAAAQETNDLQALAWERAVTEQELRDYAAALEFDKARKNEGRGPSAAFRNLGGDESIFATITENPEYRAWVDAGGATSGKPMPVIQLPEGRSLHEARTLLTTGTSSNDAGVLMPTGDPIPPMPRQMRFFVRDVIPVTQTTLNAIPYVREYTPATTEVTATGVAEGSDKPEAAMLFASDTAVVAKLAVWVPATMEILADAPTLQGYINGRLVYMLKFREEQQVINGDGTGGDLKGILQFSGVQTNGATNNDAFPDVATAIGKVELVDGDPNAVVMNPGDYWDQVATRRSTWFDGNAVNAGNAPFDAPVGRLWGLPVIRTRAISSLTVIVGDFNGAMIFDRMQTTVRQSDSHDDYFVKNKVAILAEERLALAVFRPDFFVNQTIDITA